MHGPVIYTGRILQGLDTDVHSAATSKTSSSAVTTKTRAHSAETAMVRIVMLER